MSAPIAKLAPPRLALNIAEACAALGIAELTFKNEVLPAIKTIRLGRRVLVPVSELQRWLEREASR